MLDIDVSWSPEDKQEAKDLRTVAFISGLAGPCSERKLMEPGSTQEYVEWTRLGQNHNQGFRMYFGGGAAQICIGEVAPDLDDLVNAVAEYCRENGISLV